VDDRLDEEALATEADLACLNAVHEYERRAQRGEMLVRERPDLVAGIALAHRDDEERLGRATAMLDDLYAFFRRRKD
jgi:hypothetical protein